MTKIYVVTPSYNAAETIEQTIISVLSQAGRFDLYYHVQDGGSTDDTVKILERWTKRITDGQVPQFCNSIHFSYESAPDQGMYDAIATGFEAEAFNLEADDWLTWINADDMLAPGACALMAMIDSSALRENISWVTGVAAVVSDGAVISQAARRIASEVIRHGICDGSRWDFVQQEGTFYRSALWGKVDTEAGFRDFKLAGDWNLWRQFAQLEKIHRVNYPLGLFHEREGQLSQAQRDTYWDELNETVSEAARLEALLSLAQKPMSEKIISVDYASRQLKVTDGDLAMHRRYLFLKNFGDERGDRLLAGLPGLSDDDRFADRPDPRVDFVVHDDDWQYPAVTERHAFDMASRILPQVSGIGYLAFPWATLIDKKNQFGDEPIPLEEELKNLRAIDQGFDRIVTVCQHIHFMHYADLLLDAGVTDVFWAHAVKGQDEIVSADGRSLRVHPFPLYPVQAMKIDRSTLNRPRPYLFSFVGAKSNEWYLTQSRDWILDLLADDERGFVAGRNSWHYQKIVYDHQIRQTETPATELVDNDASLKFRELLLSSVFSLCPSGSGPNSIRLWEAIGAGSIPVVLADTHQMPGDMAMWENAVVFCKETPEEIAALPDRLAEIANDDERLASMRTHLQQLWALYGAETFVSDIHKFYVDVAGEMHAENAKGSPLKMLASHINSGRSLAGDGLRNFLQLCRARLLLDKEDFACLVDGDRGVRSACEYALTHCVDEALVSDVRNRWEDVGLELPDAEVAAGQRPIPVSKPRVHLFGKHSHRTPMAYEPYKRLFKHHIEYVDDIWKADLVVTGFDIDFRSSTFLSDVVRVRPELRFSVVSEEPIWDTVWSAVTTETTGKASAGSDYLFYDVASHLNSNVFQFDRLPYFITTDDKFFQRYALHFQRNALMSVDEVMSVWRSAKSRAAFYAEKREGEEFNLFWPELGVRGLCGWRSRVAQAVQRGPIVRVGQGWNPDATRRQRLADWHLDKLTALDKQVLIVSGLENTHHRNYITEKMFDAFAVLGIPLYYADPRHRIHEICPSGGFLNLFGMSEAEASEMIDAFEPDEDFARAYLKTQKALAELFSDPETLNAERVRVVEAVMGAL